MGVALMPAIFVAPNAKKVPVRDFDAKRVISLHWNDDVANDRLDRLVSFATAHNWASSDREDFEIPYRLSGRVAIAEFVAFAFRFDRLVAGIASTEAPLAFGTCSLASNQPPSEPHVPSSTIRRRCPREVMSLLALATDLIFMADGSLWVRSGHGWICCWLDPVANDPKRSLRFVS